MAGKDEKMTTVAAVAAEEPEKAQTGRKKRMHLRVGGPGILVGALAVAVVVGAAIRIRRYRSLQEAQKRILHDRYARSGGLLSILQADEDRPHRYTMDVTAEMVLSQILEHDSVEQEIEMEEFGEGEGNEASHTDQGEWMGQEISESSAGEEEEEDYGDAEDEYAGYEAEENDDNDDDDEDEDEGECVVEKWEDGSRIKEGSSMESNAEVARAAEMKVWPLEIKEMKISYQQGRTLATQSYGFMDIYQIAKESRVSMKIKLIIWIWTMLMLLLVLPLSIINQNSYVSLYY